MSRFDAVYFPGGHGTMWDLPHNSDVAALLREADEQGKVIGAVCHGPAAFVGASGANGEPLVKGRTINSFTDAEEQAVELDETVPFLLESKLREEGGDFTKAEKFEACSVADGNLVTGQNPKSAEGVANKMLEVLDKRHSAAAE